MSVGMARISYRVVVAAAGLLCAASTAMSQDSPAVDRVSDREQITAIIRRWEEAWNSHDMHALASLFHEDGTWILWTGRVWTGRTAIEEGHAAVHKTFFRNSINANGLKS